jgi:hypothetical protein
LFLRWHVAGDDLIIDVVDDHAMRQVGRHIDYFILAGAHALGWPVMDSVLRTDGADGPKGPTLRSVVKHHLMRQLQVLADSGVVVHTEIPSMGPGVFDDVGDVIRGRVRSVGLNDDDLLQITGKAEHRGTRFFCAQPDPREQRPDERFRTVLRRTERAGHLAGELGVDQIYIHGNDVDVIRRRGVPRGAIWREMDANLLAKVAVVLALRQRLNPDAPGDPLTPLLTKEGMLAFIHFAIDVAQARHPDAPGRQQQLFREIVEGRMVFARSAAEYSTLVTPVFWPDRPPEITAGAGDMTSSVVAIFAGT